MDRSLLTATDVNKKRPRLPVILPVARAVLTTISHTSVNLNVP